MNLFVLFLVFLCFVYSHADCVDNNRKGICNDDVTGCGWYGGNCVPCEEVPVKRRCLEPYCMWNVTEELCMQTPTLAPTLPPTIACDTHLNKTSCVDGDCSWHNKRNECRDLKDCDLIRSKKVCKKRDDCEFEKKTCTSKY